MKANEIKSKSEKELKELLVEKRERIRDLRFLLSQGKVKNIREIRKMKKDIAKILTIKNQKPKIKDKRQILKTKKQ